MVLDVGNTLTEKENMVLIFVMCFIYKMVHLELNKANQDLCILMLHNHFVFLRGSAMS